MSIKIGEIYKVGNHIIACGDSSDKKFLSKVIENKKIKAVITDPPYGVSYVRNKKEIGKLGIKDAKEIVGDHIQSEKEYTEFTKKWLEVIIPHLNEYNTFHIFNSASMVFALKDGMDLRNIYFGQMLVWIKNQPVIGMKDYLSQFEIIVYGWYGKHKKERLSKEKSVIFYPKPQKSKQHPTQKPVGLIRKIIPNVTKINDYVFDGFLGGGSTAIAAEHLGRICIGIEIDPEYVETSIQRLEKLTKEKRVLISKYEPECR